MWEHAFYIDYKNVKLDYVKQIWKIVNWRDVERRYLACTKKWSIIIIVTKMNNYD